MNLILETFLITSPKTRFQWLFEPDLVSISQNKKREVNGESVEIKPLYLCRLHEEKLNSKLQIPSNLS